MRLRIAGSIFVLLMSYRVPAQACQTDAHYPWAAFDSDLYWKDFRVEHRDGTSLRGDINATLNDFGALSMDADDPNCAKAAHDRLLRKLQNTPASDWSQPLAGYLVGLVFGAAQRIGHHGWFNTALEAATSATPGASPANTLDGQLQIVIQNYRLTSQAGGCGTGLEGNSCMDDYAGSATAYAWMSAYLARRGDASSWFQALAVQSMKDFFNNVCLFNAGRFASDPTRICNGYWTELGWPAMNGPTKAFTFEHLQEDPPYGFGLITSITSAILGLDAAGVTVSFTDDQRAKAWALFREAQEHVHEWVAPDGTRNAAFESNCYKPTRDANGIWTLGPANVFCGDGIGYEPYMYHLIDTYVSFFGGYPPAPSADHTYLSNGPYSTKWNFGDFKNMFSYGRFATYRDHGWYWFWFRFGDRDTNRYMPYNTHYPIGYLDLVRDDGVAVGWACDQDAPANSLKIDVYANGWKVPDDNQQYSTYPSEGAVNSWCGAGTSHRFYIPLPSWARGLPVSVNARDTTFGAVGPLTCLESPTCQW